MLTKRLLSCVGLERSTLELLRRGNGVQSIGFARLEGKRCFMPCHFAWMMVWAFSAELQPASGRGQNLISSNLINRHHTETNLIKSRCTFVRSYTAEMVSATAKTAQSVSLGPTAQMGHKRGRKAAESAKISTTDLHPSPRPHERPPLRTPIAFRKKHLNSPSLLSKPSQNGVRQGSRQARQGHPRFGPYRYVMT